MTYENALALATKKPTGYYSNNKPKPLKVHQAIVMAYENRILNSSDLALKLGYKNRRALWQIYNKSRIFCDAYTTTTASAEPTATDITTKKYLNPRINELLAEVQDLIEAEDLKMQIYNEMKQLLGE